TGTETLERPGCAYHSERVCARAIVGTSYRIYGRRNLRITLFVLIHREQQNMAVPHYNWHRQTIAETFERICGKNNTTPWVAIGDFLDDWRRSAVEHRRELVVEPIASAT